MLAETVTDVVATKQPQPATTALRGDAKKEAFELSTFVEFANAAGISMGSPENAQPPHPDIRCQSHGDEYWFELGRIADAKLARTVGIGWPDDPTPFSFAQKEPLVRIIEKKGAARYETNGHPVDLVLHFDQQPPDREALKRHLDEQVTALNDLFQRGPFTRVWIYDKWSQSVLWHGK